MHRTTGKFILRCLGWTVNGSLPELNKYIIILAPHRSAWDFIIGKLYLMSVNVKPAILVKRELFFIPLGWIIRRRGGIAIDRSKSNNTVQKMTHAFQSNSRFILAITPEGTRQGNNSWKSGFYYIALLSKVPVIPVYCDLKNKCLYITQAYYPTGQAAEDLKLLQAQLTCNNSNKHMLS
jgi:1-acyl-sn-glycerol-3-phosphate acyltransferase